MRTTHVIALFPLALAACGDPMIGEAWLGAPAFAVRGALATAGEAAAARAHENLRLSLFWIGFDSRAEERSVVEQRAEVDDAFARFEMAVFDPPPDEALTFSPGMPEGVGLALIVLYADQNDNGALNSYTRGVEGPDVVVGASERHLVAYAAATPDAGSFAEELVGALPRGYHLFETEETASDCTFAALQACEGRGALRRVASDGASIVLTLYPEADAVRVPNPRISDGTSSTTPGNLYETP